MLTDRRVLQVPDPGSFGQLLHAARARRSFVPGAAPPAPEAPAPAPTRVVDALKRDDRPYGTAPGLLSLGTAARAAGGHGGALAALPDVASSAALCVAAAPGSLDVEGVRPSSRALRRAGVTPRTGTGSRPVPTALFRSTPAPGGSGAQPYQE